jgi:hypothetical protein
MRRIIPAHPHPSRPPVRRALAALGPLLVCALLALGAAALAAAPARAGRVLLLGVDGASWSVIDPLVAEGALPNFAALAAAGVTAELETVEPVNSPTVWTSIATGRSPEAHGIHDFLQTALDRAVPSVFERLAAAGRRVGLYDYLVTWPPTDLPGGFVIPGWTHRDHAVAPPDVFARSGLVPPYHYSVEGLRLRHEYLPRCREELQRKAAQWLALQRAFQPEVGAVTFYSVDALSHRFWRDAFPEQFDGGRPADPAVAGVIREAMIGVDRSLGEIRASLAPEDVLLVASDHGFQAGEEEEARIWTSSLERALAAADLVPGRDAFRIVSQFFAVTVRVLPGPLEERDALTERLAAALRALRAAGDSGAPLYTVDVLDGTPRPPGHERPVLDRIRQWGVRTAAAWLFDTEFGEDAHTWLLARPDRAVLDPLWPDGRVAGEGGEWPIAEIAGPDDFSGRHHPTAVLLAAGGPIRPQPARLRLSVLEIAPLLVHLAGEAVPDDLERAVPAPVLDPAWLAAHPPRLVPAASLPAPPRPGDADAGAGEEDLRERLRSMGYIRD